MSSESFLRCLVFCSALPLSRAVPRRALLPVHVLRVHCTCTTRRALQLLSKAKEEEMGEEGGGKGRRWKGKKDNGKGTRERRRKGEKGREREEIGVNIVKKDEKV